MAFNSLQYLLFLPVAFLLFYCIAHRWRWLILLLASACFYAALRVPHLLLALSFVAVITYFVGIGLDKNKVAGLRRMLFWGGIGANLLVLISLKYLPFLTKNLNALFGSYSWGFSFPQSTILVSIGASYFVFQAISYLTDIYLEIAEPEKHFGYFALYLSFFPKLLQGPIERANDLLPQLRAKYEFHYDNMRFGLLTFAWGLFKKVVIADRLALFVDQAYGNVHSFSGLSLLVATYFYAFQIYFDFSGYTDMALGAARIFNIRLTQNFNSPYLATSIADFWRRWHISFSRWILDYIFKPLQMRLRNLRNAGTAIALLATFLVSGIWHGAGWGFVIWGFLHGLCLAVSVFYKPLQKTIYKKICLDKTFIQRMWQTIATFHLVCFAWIFFRAGNTADAFYIIASIFRDIPHSLNIFTNWTLMERCLLFDINKKEYLILLMGIFYVLAVGIIKAISARHSVEDFMNNKPVFMKWLVYYGLIFSIIMLGLYNGGNFIYYQF
jgi:alginate O-acetyltransferase complex protein AlgI